MEGETSRFYWLDTLIEGIHTWYGMMSIGSADVVGSNPTGPTKKTTTERICFIP
jgi:hypothetical protein